MFREMRRKKQLLSEAETIKILKSCTSGVLAVTGDDGYPYAVPLSYVYKDNKLFFHFAKAGHKIDAIIKNDKVTFCVIEKDEVIQKTFTTHFRSAIVFGRARLLTEDSEKKYALECLVEKYSPDFLEEGQGEIERDWSRVCAAEVRIEHMTGKAAVELVNSRVEVSMSFDFDALDHDCFMREALKEAELAGLAGERPIGAVIVYQGQVIGRGRAQHRARQSEIAHAEMNALLLAEREIRAHNHDGCVIYTTVEPCVMCLGAIVMSNIDHIVYALADHWINPGAMLEMDYVRRHIKHYVGGVLENESAKLWELFNPRELKLLREGKF